MQTSLSEVYSPTDWETFNEVAYFFAEYLAAEGIPVQVNGRLWDSFFCTSSLQFLDYSYMIVNAEGSYNKTADWRNNLLFSVSAEFECIDKIYERNIIEGIIKDADLTVENLLEYLKKCENVMIMGTDIKAQDAFDYLQGSGVNVCSFVEEREIEAGKILLDKPVMSLAAARKKYDNVVCIDNHAKGSAWGGGVAGR